MSHDQEETLLLESNYTQQLISSMPVASTEEWLKYGGEWKIVDKRYNPDLTVYFESVFSQTNGYMGIRAYTEEINVVQKTFRENYLAGVFSSLDGQAKRIVGDYQWPVVEMVSLPELFAIKMILGGELFTLNSGKILEYERSIDIRNANLNRSILWESPHGRISKLEFDRFISAENVHSLCQRVSITPVNWDGHIDIENFTDVLVPTYFRWGDKEFPDIAQYHFEDVASRFIGDIGILNMVTRGTGHRISIATTIQANGWAFINSASECGIKQNARITTDEGKKVVIEKFMAVCTSRDTLPSTTGIEEYAVDTVTEMVVAGFEKLLAVHDKHWKKMWDRADIVIDGSFYDQKILRFNIFHLLQLQINKTDSLSIPARGYSFNRYCGLYFWDTEMFVFPFYAFEFPETAKNLLSYRYNMLDGAKINAKFLNSSGACFPWMTDSDMGTEQAPDKIGHTLWHQSAAVSYALDQYYTLSGDDAFVCKKALPILIETSRFWASKISSDQEGKYHLGACVGPDEGHDAGKDNAYTVLMVVKHFETLFKFLNIARQNCPDRYKNLYSENHLSEMELKLWESFLNGLHVPLVEGTDIPEQDEFLLKKMDVGLRGYELRKYFAAKKDCPILRKPYKIVKQADVLLAVSLLEDKFSKDASAIAFDFYEPITIHTSSLSWGTHAIVAAKIGRVKLAYEYYRIGAALDLENVKNYTIDGLHIASIGNTWLAVVMGFAGLHVANGKISVSPNLPQHWKSIKFNMVHNGKQISIMVYNDGSSKIG